MNGDYVSFYSWRMCSSVLLQKEPKETSAWKQICQIIYSVNKTWNAYYVLGPVLYRRGPSGEEKKTVFALVVFPGWEF